MSKVEQINKVIKTYFESNIDIDIIPAKNLMPQFISAGIYNKDHRNGLPISGNIEHYRGLLLKNNKSRFTYLTRPSSSEFTDALLSDDIDLSGLSPSDKSESNSLSKTIKNMGWYYLSWNNDPTIQSMLTMLDAIHFKFNSKAYFYERLINTEHPIITFLFLDLNEFKLTEDLYIKMNSRGKPLTSFENFKAKFEQRISGLFSENEKPFTISSKNMAASYREYFSFQIDTAWANLFWQYKELVGKPFAYDEELMNFIRVVIANQYAIENSDKLDYFKELIKNESATAELTENISFYKFQSYEALTKNCIDLLIASFDALVNGHDKIVNYFADTFYFDENDIFEKALRYSLSLPERALFHAYIRYLIIHKLDRTHFMQWMRVMHNLVENSRIEDAEQLISAIKSIEKLLKNSDNILKYLTSKRCHIDYFPSWQVDEEILKAELILKSEEWKNTIEIYEKASFHKGQIGYLFEFSGVLNYYNSNKNCNWDIKKGNQFILNFKSYASKAIQLFGIYGTENNEEYLLERALLTKGNYLFTATNSRLNLGSSRNVSNYQRDYSWKRLLRFDGNNNWVSRRSFVKELLDDEDLDLNNLQNSLLKICRNVASDWRAYFVNNHKLIGYCSQGFIYVTNDSEIELLSQSQLNHYHIDMYVYNFHLKYILPKVEFFKPFQFVKLQEVKSSEDWSYSHLFDWIYLKKHYQIKIYRVGSKFQIEFDKAKGNRNQADYAQEIETILLKCKFKWNEDDKVYSIRRESESAIYTLLKNLCSDLNNLSNE